jgi:hypothetical protein
MFSKTTAEDRADRETNRKTQTVRAKSKKDRVIDQSSSAQGAPLCDAFGGVGYGALLINALVPRNQPLGHPSLKNRGSEQGLEKNP